MNASLAVSSYISYVSRENHPTNCPFPEMALAKHLAPKRRLVNTFPLYTKPGGRRPSTKAIVACVVAGAIGTSRRDAVEQTLGIPLSNPLSLLLLAISKFVATCRGSK